MLPCITSCFSRRAKILNKLQHLAKLLFPGFVAYHFCLNLLATLSQPGSWQFSRSLYSLMPFRLTEYVSIHHSEHNCNICQQFNNELGITLP